MPNKTTENLESTPWTVAEYNTLRVLATIISIILILACTLLGTLIHPAVGLLVLVLFTIIYLKSSTRVADAEKFQMLLPIVLKKYVNRAEGPGLVYLPLTGLFPFFFSFTIMDGKLIVDEDKVQERILREQGKIQLTNVTRFSMDPKNPITLMRIGGLEKVVTLWRQEVTRRERTWVCSKTEGPQSVDDAREMKDEAVSAILWMIVGDEFQQISEGVEALIGHLNKLKPTPIERTFLKDFFVKPKKERGSLLRITKEYLKLVNNVRDGTERNTISVPSLGIIIHEFSVIDIEPIGETAESMDKINQAFNQAKVLKAEAEGYKEAAVVMSKIPNLKEDPFQAILIAKKTVTKKIDVNQFDLSQPIIDALNESFLKPLSTAVIGWLAGKTNPPAKTGNP